MKTAIPEHAFKPLQKEQLELVWQWRNSPRIMQNMHNSAPVKWLEHCAWFEKLHDDNSRQFYICLQDQRPIGVLNFSDMNTATPEWGCYLGETNVWPGSGIMLELAALDFGASHRQFSHLLAQVLSFNNSANKMHKVFEYEQVSLEKGGERNGQRFDIHHYSYELKQWVEKRDKILAKLPKNIALAAAHIQFFTVG
ncbi:UDP-4-amino-4,6-dideoxy-N-acetyl-beta-L-altrosamine N-acetyltransferase [Paraglaciecola sp. MB-3u-78]|jgi:UDP-4-amino-4,6-dideoxy-N-acetyl-beta-L-altrosamine N-acetyltransferase|uniref:UDP-4-amino-4, 6-dideoxy-N-acetyl-beta-L-altrosamine N-acetyltransferase n=1 Tax=Paraglaciecola sp. MB-3u-78 TaxID=2058332 RepID=UPI000C344405|nr:UDP-4-amino-4,6-dideoxy-N-acetyl-beta-L-altrosamine N-acetyltransferase [Paraglaciecola sp. MB-3u-78]PKH00842.1 UDP-4-amino-4,6-dideoxy-N-acetyl-beta-L-altrosamine N-acetyltransferase [Paraglaciecola sp. MB-3u-78]